MKAFPKIFALGTDYIKDIFNDTVEITEKIDGSQFAFGKIDGIVRTRSKGREIYQESVAKMFKLAVDYVHNLVLPEGLIFYCEYLNKPKHNTLAYSRVPKNNLMLFGICDTKDKFYSYKEISEYADTFRIEPVPIIFSGKMEKAEDVFDLIKKESMLGGCEMEGCVVKNYKKQFLLGSQPIPLMAGNYVSEKFKEVHHKTWKGENTSKGKFQIFKDLFRTEARWEKAVQHLRDNGELENDPRDIGKLIKEAQRDLEEEEKENIKDFLYKEFGKEILRHATRGLPEWYKKRLITFKND